MVLSFKYHTENELKESDQRNQPEQGKIEGAPKRVILLDACMGKNPNQSSAGKT